MLILLRARVPSRLFSSGLAAFLLVLMGGAALAQETTKVTFAGWGPPDLGSSFLFTAVEKGFFKEAGIDFKFVASQGDADALRRLLTGDAQFAWTGPELLMLSADQGGQAMGVFNIHNNFYHLAYLPEKIGFHASKIQDFKGKKIGVGAVGSVTQHVIMQALADAGMRQDDVTFLAVGFAPAALLQSGQIDAFVSWPRLTAGMRAAGLHVEEYWTGLEFPTDQISVSKATYMNNKKLIDRFVSAVVKGIRYETANEAEAAQYLPKYLTAPIKPEDAKPLIADTEHWIHYPATEREGLGYTDIASLMPVLATLRNAGLVKIQVDLDQIFTNEFQQKYGR